LSLHNKKDICICHVHFDLYLGNWMINQFLQKVGCARFCSAGQVLIQLSASLEAMLMFQWLLQFTLTIVCLLTV